MIEIIDANLITLVWDAGKMWSCILEITQGDQAWILPATAPGDLAESELQSYFDGMEDYLWQVAEEKQYEPDIYIHLPHRKLLHAVALVIIDEINILRAEHGLAERTAKQAEAAIIARLKELRKLA